MFTACLPNSKKLIAAATLVAALFAFGLLSPSPAVADDAQSQAEQLFVEGREQLRQGENVKAAELFLEAYELIGLPELLYNIAHAYRRGDELALAEKYYQEYLNEASDPPNEEDVIETIFEIQQQRAARKATLTLITEPAGATVSVDDLDESSCQTPCELDLDPGQYELQAHLADHHPQQRRIELDARQARSVTLTLESEIAYGRLRVQSDVDGATLLAGGQTYTLPRSAPVELEAGPQTIVLEWRGNRYDHSVDIERNQETHLFVPLGATGGGDLSLLQTSAIGLGGASLALAAAATMTGLQANATHQRLEMQQQNLGIVDPDLVHTGQRQKSMTNMLWIGTVVTLGAGAGLWAWDMFGSSSGDSERLEPTPDDDDLDSSSNGTEVDLL